MFSFLLFDSVIVDAAAPPSPVEFVLVASVAPCEATIAWKSPRCNGDWVNCYLVKWTRVRQVLSQDDSESDGDGKDSIADSCFSSIVQEITFGLVPSVDGEPLRVNSQTDKEAWLWKSVPTSRGAAEVSLDKLAASMTREVKEPTRTVRMEQLRQCREFNHLSPQLQATFEMIPRRDLFGTRDQPLRYALKTLRPGAYYRVGIAAHNSEGWSEFSEYPSPVRIMARVPSRPSKPFAVSLSPTSLVVCWSVPRSNGSSITGYNLFRKRCLDKEESRYHDEALSM